MTSISVGVSAIADDTVELLDRAMEAAAGKPYVERVQGIAEAVVATHDLEWIARELDAPSWDAASVSDRALLSAAVGELASAVLAANADGEAGEPIERQGDFESDGEQATVKCGVPAERGPNRQFAYRLRSSGDQWRIVGLTVGGGPGYELIASSAAAAESIVERAGELRALAARFAQRPGEVVARLQAGLIDVMKRAEELGYRGRYELLAPLIADTHDFESIAKLVLGRAWRGLAADQRATLIRSFERLAIANYAARFDAYDGQSFGAPRGDELQRGAMMVKTSFRKAGGGEVSFDYLMRRAGGRWMILNIVVDGVSDLALKRTEYSELLTSEGYAALKAKLDQQIARYEAGTKD